ncbi:MAG: NAD(P)-binding protein [Chloroflexi bacterium]|nr:NAD(P)-binding protein [Chloroflexota bacterium]
MAKQSSNSKEHIVVLGGGIGSLSAVFELTNQAGWQDKYDITVYQMGWRLGGKGASGRDQSDHDRILEHGLHIWFGFYQNAFNMMYQVYNELGRPADAPLPTVQKAFTGQNFFVFEENINGQWLQWPIKFPHTDDFPGIPGTDGRVTELPSLWDYIQEILQWVHDFVPKHFSNQIAAADVRQRKPHWWQRLGDTLENDVANFENKTVADFLELAVKLALKMPSDPEQQSAEHTSIIQYLLREFKQWLEKEVEHVLDSHTDLRRAFMLVDLALTCAIGLIAEGVTSHGLQHLDDMEFKEFLRKYHAAEISINSTLVQSLYDSSFAFESGDITKPSFAAGTALRVILRVLFTYKGSVIFKMNAGMGDTIFAPVYEVLKKRGVNFEFFHRIKNLKLSPDGNWIEAIEMAQQVRVKKQDIGNGEEKREYQPLFDVKGLPCWPDRPFYDQLEDGDKLKASGANLESRWANWEDYNPHKVLEFGKDFDKIVLGISIYALRDITKELMARDASWNDMVMNVNTTQTQALQLWFKPKIEDMWRYPPAIIASYVEEFSSIADFTQTLDRENWNPNDPNAPHTIIYTCGVIKDDFGSELPPPTDHEWPAQELARVQQTTDILLNQTGPIWPGVSNSNGTVKPETIQGQYQRINIDPTERYVLSSPKTGQYRKKTDNSGFDNLYLTGTWIDSGFNFGCIENGVMSGMQCSRAMTGHPELIVGEKDILHDE